MRRRKTMKRAMMKETGEAEEEEEGDGEGDDEGDW
jgi:hypothetical protein